MKYLDSECLLSFGGVMLNFSFNEPVFVGQFLHTFSNIKVIISVLGLLYVSVVALA